MDDACSQMISLIVIQGAICGYCEKPLSAYPPENRVAYIDDKKEEQREAHDNLHVVHIACDLLAERESGLPWANRRFRACRPRLLDFEEGIRILVDWDHPYGPGILAESPDYRWRHEMPRSSFDPNSQT